jgi:hypothetical protein
MFRKKDDSACTTLQVDWNLELDELVSPMNWR